MRKFFLIATTLGLVVLLAWQIKQKLTEANVDGGGQRGRPAMAIAVESAEVRRGEIRDIRTFTGTLQPRARFVFAPKIGGRLEKLPVNIGEPLQPGQEIARLDDGEYVQQVNQARAALEVMAAAVEQQQTALDLARREMQRIKALRDKKIASEAEWDQAESRYKTQAAQLKVAEAQMAEKQSALNGAEVRLSYTRIMAPPDPGSGQWWVEERFVDEGAMLASNTPLVSVVDLSVLTAVIQVIERDYPSISEGLSVEISTDAFAGRSFTGQVLRIAPVLRESSRQARVEIAIPNQDLLLRPGMFIRAQLQFEQRSDAVLVPPAALVTRNEQPGVFSIDPATQTASFIPIQVGIRAATSVEILAPPLSGRVVTLGQHLLTDGSKVIFGDPAPALNAATADAASRGDAQ